MADEENLAKEASEFLHTSCQQLMPHCFNLAEYFRGKSYPVKHPVDGTKCKVFPVVTGSKAELYIDPMLSCVGDIDVMYNYSSELAIPVGYPPPTQLPTDFDSCVKVFEIVDSHMPGYVYLDLAYIISRNKNTNKYVVTKHVKRWNSVLSHDLYITAGVNGNAKIHGPACMAIQKMHSFIKISGTLDISIDTVPCVRCLEWPMQADIWPIRHRNYGWPNVTTVDRVVSNGCDVVGVAHALCREDEWTSNHQWRLSFSRAEVVLLNSWIPIQQILYHMLRIFMKTERLTDSANNTDKSMLCNYHIKTLMLWACEVKPLDWWTGGYTLVSLCMQLLQFFDQWLTKMNGQHYFINDVHYLHYFDKFTIDTIAAVVNSTTEQCLSRWFVDNYIRKCAELCPDNISLLFGDVMTSKILHDTASTILKWRDHIAYRIYAKHVLSMFVGVTVLPNFRSWSVSQVDMFVTMSKSMFSMWFSMWLSFVTVPSRFNIFKYFNSFMCLMIDTVNH